MFCFSGACAQPTRMLCLSASPALFSISGRWLQVYHNYKHALGSNLVTLLQFQWDQVTPLSMTLLITLGVETDVFPISAPRTCWIWPPYLSNSYCSPLCLLNTSAHPPHLHSRGHMEFARHTPISVPVPAGPPGNHLPFSLTYVKTWHKFTFWGRLFLITPLKSQSPLILLIFLPIFIFFL